MEGKRDAEILASPAVAVLSSPLPSIGGRAGEERGRERRCGVWIWNFSKRINQDIISTSRTLLKCLGHRYAFRTLYLHPGHYSSVWDTDMHSGHYIYIQDTTQVFGTPICIQDIISTSRTPLKWLGHRYAFRTLYLHPGHYSSG